MAPIHDLRLLRRGALTAVAAGAAVLTLVGQALADVPVTHVSHDPFTNRAAFHQTEVEPDNYSFGSTIVAVHQTGRFADGGSDDTGWATSTDNGGHWTHGFLPGTTVFATPPGPWARISDPSVAYDPKHDVWMIAGLAIDSSVTGKAVLVSRSIDGGLTWGKPVTVSQGGGGSFYDKEWITCDTTSSSPFYGNCYVEWDDFGQGNALRLSRSTNGGQSWHRSKAPGTAVIGGQPLVQPNGTVVMPISTNNVASFVSSDGGLTYTGPYVVSNFQLHGASGMRDGGGLVSAEVDGGGRVYVAWYDCRFRSHCSADDIVFSTSTDGKHWSAVRRIPAVPTSSSAELFLPGIGADHTTAGSTAHVGVTFYFFPNGNCTPSTCKLDAGFISSTDGGQTWGSPVKLFGPISEKGLANAGGYFVGDYISTAFGSNGKAYPVIADAMGSSCLQGHITSCHEFMVAPTNGLPVLGGAVQATTGPVLSRGRMLSVIGRTAF